MHSPLKKLSLTLFLLAFTLCGYAQRNLSGKKGLIYVPSAEESLDGEWSLGYVYNPAQYSLRNNGKLSEQILFTNINLLPRLQVSFFLLQARADGKRLKKEGLGDRQLDLRYQILREDKNKPSLAFILSSPFTLDAALQTHVLVASKTLQNKRFSFTPSLGIGSPYYLFRKEDDLTNGNIFSNFAWQKKSEDSFGNNYLTGVFGGFKAGYDDFFFIMAEWDGQKINTGLSATFFKKLNAQVSLLNFDQVSFGFSYATNLKTHP